MGDTAPQSGIVTDLDVTTCNSTSWTFGLSHLIQCVLRELSGYPFMVVIQL